MKIVRMIEHMQNETRLHALKYSLAFEMLKFPIC